MKGYCRLARPVTLASYAAIVGPREGKGPFGAWFDRVNQDDTFGQNTFEDAERQLATLTSQLALEKAGRTPADMDCFLAGDLLNQLVSSSFTAHELGIPYLGQYGACSTMSQTLALGSLLIGGGMADHVLCTASSHFATAERQYRFPLEFGTQRAPTSQRTVTGSGSIVLTHEDGPLAITEVLIGRVVDLGVCDANNMGAAMAPAAADTLLRYFEVSSRSPTDFDYLVTGDLGAVGSRLMHTLLQEAGLDIRDRHLDCGCEIYRGMMGRLLFMATGALLSTTTSQQGKSVPGVAHAVVIERRDQP